MNRNEKIEILNFWVQNSDKVGEIPPKLSITQDEANDLFVQIEGSDKKDLINFRDELKKEIQEEKDERKEKIEWFKTWVYPILAPIIVAVILFFIMGHVLNPPKVIETSLMSYYDVPASVDVPLSFWISNPNSDKLIIFSIGYQFNWKNPNPEGQKFTPLETPQLNPLDNMGNNQKSNEDILNSAGQEGDSKLISVTFKSPPLSNNLYTIKIIINTNKGEVIKEVKLNPIEVKNE